MSELQPTRRLGRGLSALLGGGAPAHQETTPEEHSELRQIPIGQITRNPFQPRQIFDQESLGELASSIREHGVLQPLIVRAVESGYQLVAGERRWQAAQKAGLTNVPCRVVDVIDKTACEFALEENLKRKDLNDLEKAMAFREYIDHFECTIEELAKQLSMSRSSVNNMLRLLDLADPVKNALHAGKITAGHARTLLPLDVADQLAMCGRIQAESLSVRQTEKEVRTLLGRPQPEAQPAEQSSANVAAETVTTETATAESDAVPAMTSDAAPEFAASTELAHEATGDDSATISIEEARDQADELRTAHVASMEEQLSAAFGVKVQIKLKTKETGFIVLPFASNTDFERILKLARRAA
ncbi:MAG: ParB/RepB/Spo0J family partition protein [Planctomycetaceae bacterium]|nr:ParB/RepB/Spo0J family partition protein [Planctomycetaceae bacterium]